MPLTLACTGNATADLGILTRLRFVFNWTLKLAGDWVEGDCELQVTVSVTGDSRGMSSFPGLSGQWVAELTPSVWQENWASANVFIQLGRSLGRGQSYPGYTLNFDFYIIQTWTYTDPVTMEVTTKEVYSYGIGNDSTTCLTGWPYPDNTLQGMASGGGGAGFISLFLSCPLCNCTYVGINLAGFSNPPLANTLSLQNFCLAATGGVEPYYFTIASGSLPNGQNLDGDTGCIEGTGVAGQVGSWPITFRVMDSTGATADVTCNTSNPNNVSDCGCVLNSTLEMIGDSIFTVPVTNIGTIYGDNSTLNMIGDSIFSITIRKNELLPVSGCMESADDLLYYRGYLGRI